jgi:Bacteriophage replication gene A protein (GPA)
MVSAPRAPTLYTERRGFVPFEVRARVELQAHVAKLMQGMPERWIQRVYAEWEGRRQKSPTDAARWGLKLVRQLKAGEFEGVTIGASDRDVCERARQCARHVVDMLHTIEKNAHQRAALSVAIVDDFGQVWHVAPRRSFVTDRGFARSLPMPVVDREALAVEVLREQMQWVLQDFERRGLAPFLPAGPGITAPGMLARLKDDRWWRRLLRRTHAAVMETAAIGLGMVRAGRGGECYVSTESLKRRAGQIARNAAALQGTLAVNDQAEAMTLAEIAAKGMADKAIRRNELMTRIAGFEVIAKGLAHQAVFLTLTCPSRMHKWRRGDRNMATPNPAYDGSTPAQAQEYLATQWARFRAKAARRGLRVYGFRIAEPHHDGCPHWHALLWFEDRCEQPETGRVVKAVAKGLASFWQADALETLQHLLREFFLFNDSPKEKGASKHRIKLEVIDPAKGSAASYVAKYVAKNVDGMHVERDLYGNDTLESSRRVEAWASTWRIRQFQQIGGAPVTTWRELRRVHPGNVPADAADALHQAVEAVNVSAIGRALSDDGQEAERERIANGWADYVRLQGGPLARRRDHQVRMHRDDSGEVGRYGDPKARAVVGVSAQSITYERFGIVARHRRVRVDVVESERAAWVTVPVGNDRRATAVATAARMLANRAQVAAKGRAVRHEHLRAWRDRAATLKRGGQRATLRPAPWTRVNNCTESDDPFKPKVIHTPKRGQVFRWNRGRFNEENSHEQAARSGQQGPNPDQNRR